MTTAIAARKAAAGRTPKAAKKKLRIREELLPETARYTDFTDWFEDQMLSAVANDRKNRKEYKTVSLKDAFSRLGLTS